MRHKANPVYKYEVQFMESERGWGQNYWTNLYDTREEAMQAIADTNAKNPPGPAPDYYIQAMGPARPVEVDRDGNPC